MGYHRTAVNRIGADCLQRRVECGEGWGKDVGKGTIHGASFYLRRGSPPGYHVELAMYRRIFHCFFFSQHATTGRIAIRRYPALMCVVPRLRGHRNVLQATREGFTGHPQSQSAGWRSAMQCDGWRFEGLANAGGASPAYRYRLRLGEASRSAKQPEGQLLLSPGRSQLPLCRLWRQIGFGDRSRSGHASLALQIGGASVQGALQVLHGWRA